MDLGKQYFWQEKEVYNHISNLIEIRQSKLSRVRPTLTVLPFSDEEKESELCKGLEMIYKQTLETFEKLGVSKIEALGCEFDPELHNAVMHIEDETTADNTIVEEFQKGYTYRDKVIRYSMVKVIA